MYKLLSFVTNSVSFPWTDSDIKNFKVNGSLRDKVIYNSKLNARYILESNEGGYSYSCSIKLPNGKYRNFTIAPMTFNHFFIVIYVGSLGTLHNITRNEITDRVLPKFYLLKKSIESATVEGGIALSENCRIMGDCIWYKVQAPISQFLYPRNENISNMEILDSYKKICFLYNQIQKELDEFISVYNKICTAITNKYEAVLRRIESERKMREEKVKQLLVRKSARVLISTGIAVASGGMLLDINGLTDAFADLSDIAELSDLSEMGDMLSGLDNECYDIANIDILNSTLPNLEEVDINDYDNELSEYDNLNPDSYNVSFGKREEIIVHQEGNSDRKIRLKVEKVPGTSHKWNVYKTDGSFVATVDSIKNGTLDVRGFGTIKF